MLKYNQQYINKDKVTFLILRSQNTPSSKGLGHQQTPKGSRTNVAVNFWAFFIG